MEKILVKLISLEFLYDVELMLNDDRKIIMI